MPKRPGVWVRALAARPPEDDLARVWGERAEPGSSMVVRGAGAGNQNWPRKGRKPSKGGLTTSGVAVPSIDLAGVGKRPAYCVWGNFTQVFCPWKARTACDELMNPSFEMQAPEKIRRSPLLFSTHLTCEGRIPGHLAWSPPFERGVYLAPDKATVGSIYPPSATSSSI